MYILEFAGEQKTMPLAELRGILEGENISFNYFADFPVSVFSDIKNVEKRAAFTKTISTYLFQSDLDTILNKMKNIDFHADSFAVRIKNYSTKNVDTRALERKIGGIYYKKVNLKDPEKEIRVLVTDESVYAGFMIHNGFNKSIRERNNENRPFRTNLSLSSNYARFLVNLARVKEKDTILDPFCGGGSILIEASAMGINANGTDIDRDMVQGAKLNLEHFALDASVYVGDVSKISEYFGTLDAIVTDPPYGRSAFINKEKVSDLYDRSFREFKKLVKYGGFISIILPHYDYIKIGSRYFKLIEYHKLKVHKSLNRYFCVFKNVQD